MKIIVPTIRATAVGTRYNFGVDTVFDCPDRPNVYNDVITTTVYDRSLAALTVFDYDFRVAQRAVGVCQLALAAVMMAVLLPLAALAITAATIERATDFVGEFLASLLDAAGIPTSGAFAKLVRKVFAA